MPSTQRSSSVLFQTDSDHSTISEDNRALALKLSGHLGLEGALSVSSKNQWHGVVAALRELQQKRRSRQ
ncbi:hypothetical protein [Kordiimonas pumila]|uniref:Uncharacterized protein n=1 Tax=Kordiimonas pumila TaxID=2161677 RepID=A0ABV7D5H4_9PROT|nr:hypothetical protein [Kordiimonas pumila]